MGWIYFQQTNRVQSVRSRTIQASEKRLTWPMDDQMILDLKAKKKSLRQIASTLGLSHEAVRKRLKSLESKDRLSTKERNQELTVAIEKEKVSTAPNAHQSRASEESKSVVNLIPSVETPSHTLTEGVNPLGTPSDKLPECKKGVFQGVDSESGDLFERIKVFLESKGIEVYRIQVEQEAYQVRHNGQVIRFYVHRKQTGESQVPRTD